VPCEKNKENDQGRNIGQSNQQIRRRFKILQSRTIMAKSYHLLFLLVTLLMFKTEGDLTGG